MITPSAIRNLWPWLAAVSSGILLTLSFPPFNQAGLIWFALLPLLAALWAAPKQTPKWRAPLLGYTTGVVFFAATFYWLSELADLFNTPALHGLSLLLALYLGLYPAAWAWLVSNPPSPGPSNASSSLRNIVFTIRASCAWVALDWLRGWLFTGFGWNSPGIALHQNLALIQIADLFGVHGITFVIIFSTVTIAVVIRRVTIASSIRALPNLRAEMMTAILLVGLSVSYGLRAVIQKPPTSTLPLRAIVLQPNIPQEEKFDPASEDLVLQKIGRLMELANAIGPSPDLIVWPEAATPRGMFADEINHSFTLNQAKQASAPLLIGTLEPVFTGPDGEGEMVDYNSAVLIGGSDVALQSYRKRHIVPFGEFLPFREWLPEAIRQLVPGDLAQGKEANLLFLKKPAVRLGALVCFEDSLARETRALVREGAQLLVNLTNDSWFGTSAGAAQHLANAKFRAIEARLPLIRCANTGETCSVDSIGRVDQRLMAFTEGIDTLLVQVPEHPIPTAYTRFGDLWVIACGLAALMLARRTHAER